MKNTICFLQLISVLLFSGCLNEKPVQKSEVPSFTFITGGSGDETANDLVVSEEGDIFCFGTTTSLTYGGKDFYIVKTSRDGKILFTSHYGSDKDEVGYAMTFTDDGGLMLAGYTNGYGALSKDFLTVKINSSGDILKYQTYPGGHDEVGTAILRIPGDGYLLGGFRETPLKGRDFLLIRIDPDGQERWHKTYGGLQDDYISSMCSDGFGNLVVFGNTISYGAGNQDFYLMKLDQNGDSLWARTYGSSDYEQAGSVVRTPDGYYLCGHTAGFGHPEHQVYLVKTDPDGFQVWDKQYGGVMHDGAEKMLLTDNGSLVMAGYSSSYGNGDMDFLLVQADASGNLERTQSFGNAGPDAAFGLASSSTSWYLAGYTTDSLNATSDLMLIKTAK